MRRLVFLGWFGAITWSSCVALAQAEGQVPTAPAAAAPAAAEGAAPAGPGANTAPARPTAKKQEAAKPKQAQPAAAQPAAAQPAAAQPTPASPPVAAQPAAVPDPAAAVPPPPEAEHGEHAAAHPSETPAEHADTAHGVAVSGEHAEHGHGAGHDTAEPPYIEDVNWFYGLLGESDDGEPNLLYRPKGMPIPFLATLINWGILIGLIVMMARKQLPAALAKRKAGIVQAMQEAQKARDESAERLAEYEARLAKIDSDIERIKTEMRKAGEIERDRILAEAVERRTRMERDARRLIDTEIEATKEALRREVVQTALSAAKRSIEGHVATADQQRLFEEAMSNLKNLPSRSLGGQA